MAASEILHDLSQQKANRPLVMAHRGGGGLWPENTMLALMHGHNAITLCLAMILLRYPFLLILLEITLYRVTNS